MTNEKALVRRILEAGPRTPGWTAQGLGMIRLPLDAPRLRLHVWDPRLRAPGVSDMHDHPWGFRSTVVAGRVVNDRYVEIPIRQVEAGHWPTARGYWRQTLRCGEGDSLEGGPVATYVVGDTYAGDEVWEEGGAYEQEASEIHVSSPEGGTVTIVERVVPEGASPDHAHVFWPDGGEWVSAEPRPATAPEVSAACGLALERWF